MTKGERVERDHRGGRSCGPPALLFAMMLAACHDLETIRQFTYPPDFKYVTQEELRSNMQRLAYQLQQMDAVLASSPPKTVNQQEIVDVLGEVQGIGSSLQAGQGGANHPFLEDMMPQFVITVGKARLSAQQDPSRSYLAGQVSGACLNCHSINR